MPVYSVWSFVGEEEIQTSARFPYISYHPPRSAKAMEIQSFFGEHGVTVQNRSNMSSE